MVHESDATFAVLNESKLYKPVAKLVANRRLNTMTGALRTLALTILSGVDAIEAAYSQAGVPFPSLDEPFSPSPLDGDAALMDAQRLVASAAAQIIAHAQQPLETLQESVMSTYMTASLGFVVDVNIPDILKDAGSQVSSKSRDVQVLSYVIIQGLDANDIATAAGVSNAVHLSKEPNKHC